jgi:hypothetical protein
VNEGKAVIKMYADSSFYSFKFSSDTANIKNGNFEFKGNISYPQQFFIKFLNQNTYISESFFLDTGFQTIIIDTLKERSNFWDMGYGIEIKGSHAHNKYVSDYLKLYDSIKYKTKLLLLELEDADSISMEQNRNSAIEISKAKLLSLRYKRDSILLDYVTQNPKSQILPWILDRSIWKYGYNENYQKAFDLIDGSFPKNLTVSLSVLLNKSKLKIPNKIFPLLDFIVFNKPDKQSILNKYTLVEFWFSGCSPCLKQFDLLIPIIKITSQRGLELLLYQLMEKNLKRNTS